MKLFEVEDNGGYSYEVSAIHNKDGYEKIRRDLSEKYNRAFYFPNIQIYNIDIYGDRDMTLLYSPYNNMELDEDQVDLVLLHVRRLWGFPIRLIKLEDNEEVLIGKID